MNVLVRTFVGVSLCVCVRTHIKFLHNKYVFYRSVTRKICCVLTLFTFFSTNFPTINNFINFNNFNEEHHFSLWKIQFTVLVCSAGTSFAIANIATCLQFNLFFFKPVNVRKYIEDFRWGCCVFFFLFSSRILLKWFRSMLVRLFILIRR